MINEIQSLLDSYLKWLRDRTVVKQINDWVEITTPYLDRHNDYIQIYAKQSNGRFIITDDGETINDLEMSGCKINSPKRQDILRMILNGFGVQEDKGALQVNASRENFALRKHNLVQAMLAVNDMFYLAVPIVASLFYEDVTAWLDSNDVRYTPSVKFSGKSGYDHLFDFVIPKSKLEPERILKTINRPSRETAQSVAFAWIDTREVRTLESRAFAILNDSELTSANSVIDALISYNMKPILWSRRDEVIEELAA